MASTRRREADAYLKSLGRNYGGRPPLGTIWVHPRDGSRKRIEMDLGKREIMGAIVEWHDAGVSFRRISDLIERDLAAREGRPYRPAGFRRQWSKSSVHNAYETEKRYQAEGR